MKKLAGIVSLICMIVTADCGAEPNLNDGTLSNAPSNIPVKDLKESAEATSPSKEIQTNANEPQLLAVLPLVKINDDELNTLTQNSQQASVIADTSELWKTLLAENQKNS